MEDLVHVGIPLLPRHFGEQQAGHQEVDAAQSWEYVAFDFLHVLIRCFTTTRDETVNLAKL